jgi:hypothetical protein
MFELSSALGILSAMITPAILILASGSLILTTSNRLTRVIDRVRELATLIEEIPPPIGTGGGEEDKRRLLSELLEKAIGRARLLQRAMTLLYLALAMFVGTSMAIGVLALTDVDFAVAALLLGFFGAGFMLWSSFLLIVESRLALASTLREMDYLARHTAYVPGPQVERLEKEVGREA